MTSVFKITSYHYYRIKCTNNSIIIIRIDAVNNKMDYWLLLISYYIQRYFKIYVI